ncbi:Protein kinase domain [Dillenia turbinata]|uniref:Protein kinase domain n=1 Tax=Dillenia turbinata TaxID=194707 RepID=A0AAN8W4U6_9MAGN
MGSPNFVSNVVLALDATKDHTEHEIQLTVNNVRSRGDILKSGDRFIVLGILHRVPHPLGCQTVACPTSFAGTNIRAMEEEVLKRVDIYTSWLTQTAANCEGEGVTIEVRVTAGNPLKKILLQEIMACNASWVILDRHLRRETRALVKQIPCKVASVLDCLAVEILRSQGTEYANATEHKLFYSISKPVHVSIGQDIDHYALPSKSYSASISSLESSDMLRSSFRSSTAYSSRDTSFPTKDDFGSSSFERSGRYSKEENRYPIASQIIQKPCKIPSRQRSSEGLVLCTACGTRTELYIKESMKFSFSEIQTATDNFSSENLLGEGGYGFVYKGELKDGQLIAAKVRKEASMQGFSEFHSEVYVLSFARHRNIVMLLGYCCKEDLNILVYEYICNKSLEWHLFDKEARVLEWHQRHDIAIGTAKGLRFLHEECRGGPIIHRDMRPSNILLTHDFVPMLGDFGLAKWKHNEDAWQTRILGTLGYLAPEYAENGIVSVRTDVYAFGIVLLQLISGRKAVDGKKEETQTLREWAESVIERLALHELIDPRIGDSYDTYELYHMAKTAYFCVQRSPEMRPSMAEVCRDSFKDHYHP